MKDDFTADFKKPRYFPYFYIFKAYIYPTIKDINAV
jgi:hypothetical protein